MIEGPPPVNPAETSPHIEGEGKTYEEIVSLGKILQKEGVDCFEYDDYTEHPDERVVELRDYLSEWEASKGLALRYARTAQRARDTVLAAGFWINAGYTEQIFISEARHRLVNEEQDAQNDPEKTNESEEVLAIFADAIAKLEEKLPNNLVVIEQTIEDAQKKYEQGSFIDTSQMLTNILLSTKHRKILEKDPALKERITALRDEATDQLHKQRGFGKYAKKD
jgi:hypothetical protein